MAEFRRRYPGYIPLKPLPIGPQIPIGKYPVDFDRYHEMKATDYATICKRLAVRKSIDQPAFDRAIKAVTCGRLVAQDKADSNSYERSYGCRITQLCPRCYYENEKRKALDQISDVERCIGRRLLGYVFTLPAPESEQKAIELAGLGHSASRHLLDAINRWKNKRGELYRVGHYVMGCHAKPTRISPYLWTHVHLAIFVAPSCPVKSRDGLTEYLTQAFAHAIDTSRPIVKCEDYGILSHQQLTPAKRIKNRRGNTCSVKCASNLFAYTTRYLEDDDTPESIADRDHLYASADIRSPSQRSRRLSNGEPIKKSHLAHEFDAKSLGKKQSFVFPIGNPYREFDPAVYKHERMELLRSARSNLISDIGHLLTFDPSAQENQK